MNTKYEFKEIFRLRDMLDKKNIKYVFEDNTYLIGEKEFTSYHIWLFDNEEEKMKDNFFISIIQNFGSYGREQDLLEIMGLLTKKEQPCGVAGYLTAENVFKRIKKHLKEME